MTPAQRLAIGLVAGGGAIGIAVGYLFTSSGRPNGAALLALALVGVAAYFLSDITIDRRDHR